MTAVRVQWTDAQGDANGWTTFADLDAVPCLVDTIGTLLEPPPRADHVSVALSVVRGADGEIAQLDSVVHIPALMVLSVTTLGG